VTAPREAASALHLKWRNARAAKRPAERAFPSDAGALRRDPLFKAWWYYSIELLPDAVTNGIYRPDLPMLPRIMLRNCELAGMECLDVGTMEGLVPTLMARGGAGRVMGVDALDHCLQKLDAVKHYYDVSFEYQSVGTMYELDKKLPGNGFDLVNCSGLLYHVFSPLMVLAGIRPLVKRNGLVIVSTCVVEEDGFSMTFNDAGRLQSETNTFWYVSPSLLDYVLRYLKLAPVDCLYVPYGPFQPELAERFDKPVGYASVLCRAMDDVVATAGDSWMAESARQSWEHGWLVDWERASRQPISPIRQLNPPPVEYQRHDLQRRPLARLLGNRPELVDVAKMVRDRPRIAVDQHVDSHLLRLADRA
jgi:2-polyprenyl-3-methyl-5-hydroxy-6-metoxy-1,4-benzoquinol methylase